MIGKKSIGNLVGAWYAAIYGALIMMVICAYWPGMSIAVFLLLSSAVCIAVYWAGRWIHARKELNKKLPVSSKELRRRKKDFYDRLAKQGPLSHDTSLAKVEILERQACERPAATPWGARSFAHFAKDGYWTVDTIGL